MTGLHADSITKTLGNQNILQDVYLGCQKGEIAGLLGRNGSGKTTLLKIIFGAENADTKFVRVADKIIKKQKDCVGKIAYLPQHHFFPKNITIQRLLSLFCSETNVQILTNDKLIQPLLKSKPSELSGGELRIAEIMLTVYSSNDFVLLDEPFQNLSPKAVEEIKQHIKLQALEKGFVVSDHQYEHVIDISDKIFLLSEKSLKPIKNIEDLIRYRYLK